MDGEVRYVRLADLQAFFNGLTFLATGQRLNRQKRRDYLRSLRKRGKGWTK